MRHHDIVFEQRVMNAITKGNEQELIQCFRSFPTQCAGILSQKSQIRSLKNIVITTIALAIRAAIKGGIYYEAAYSLSDAYIQKAEELEDEQQLIRFLEWVLVDLTKKVALKLTQKYSKPIFTCINYIQLHLNEEITLEQLARLVKLHPKYVSYLFKKELNVSLQTYIQKERIEEAQKLLLFSHYSIAVIAEQLNFYDQSHFTKTFKRYTGFTPKEYQNQQLKYYKISSKSESC